MSATAYDLRNRLAPRQTMDDRRLTTTRERTSLEWWERSAEIDDCSYPAWAMYGGDFLAYLSSGGPIHCLPPEVTIEVGHEMFEAAREAGYGVIEDFIRRLVPVLDAIDRAASSVEQEEGK